MVSGDTILFIGGYFEVTNPGTQEQAITKYYFAGGQRVAVRQVREAGWEVSGVSIPLSFL